VTVVAADATTADALSTAFALMTDAAIAARIQSLRGLRVLVAEGGRVTAING